MDQKDMIDRVIGNGPFEMEEVAKVKALAQLGARVLEILREHVSGEFVDDGHEGYAEAARSLGLLQEVQP